MSQPHRSYSTWSLVRQPAPCSLSYSGVGEQAGNEIGLIRVDDDAGSYPGLSNQEAVQARRKAAVGLLPGELNWNHEDKIVKGPQGE